MLKLLLLLLLIFYALINDIKKYEYFKIMVYKYAGFFNNYFINKSDYENILLLGFVTDDTKNYFEMNFPNANITIINLEKKIYISQSLMTNIIYGVSPYDIQLINTLKDKKNIYDIIILEGETITETMVFCCKNYFDLLNPEKGIFMIEIDPDEDIYNDISLIIKEGIGLTYKSTTIKVFDYSKNKNNNMGIILSIDNKIN